MSKIAKRVEILQDLAAQLVGLLQDIEALRLIAADEIEREGEITQSTCEKMATAMAEYHVLSAKLHNGGHSLHQSMSGFIPEGANEGNKEWPPQP